MVKRNSWETFWIMLVSFFAWPIHAYMMCALDLSKQVDKDRIEKHVNDAINTRTYRHN